MAIVIYGVGSRMVGEIAETCIRLGIQIAAWIRNIDGPVFVPGNAEVTEADDISTELIQHSFVVPQFTPADRRAALVEARSRGFLDVSTLIDPTAVIATSAVVGKGSYINCMAHIGAATRLGSSAFINRGASIGHDVDLAEFVSIGPAAVIAGGVSIGRGTVIGAAAIILPDIRIGENAIIGAGAVVTKPVPSFSVVRGNPAKMIAKNILGFNGRGI